MQNRVYEKLKRYAEDVQLLGLPNDDAIKNVVNSLSEKEIKLSTVYKSLIPTYNDAGIESTITAIKKVGNIELTDPINKDIINSRTLMFNDAVIEYLARYLVKRRAVHLYVFALFQMKNFEFQQMLRSLQQKSLSLQKAQVSSQAAKGENMIRQMQATIMEELAIKLPHDEKFQKFLNDMFEAYAKQNKEVNAVYKDLAAIIADMQGKVKGYEELVQDVIPMIARWNDKII